MNCVNHPQAPATAYCRTCGKALCEECKRDVRGVIYCEDCIVARLSDTLPPVQPGAAAAVPVVVSSGPNPTIAAILGAIPFGIGAVYNGQYAKGLVHMVVFVSLIVGVDNAPGGLEVLFGLAIPFWIIYQIVDAYRTAKARQLGLPLPDPFGINRMLGYDPAGSDSVPGAVPAATGAATGPAAPAQPAMPVGPVILIALGTLFLLHTMSILPWGVHNFWPLILLALAAYLFIRQPVPRRNFVGPVVLATLGIQGLLAEFTRWGFGRTMPLLLIAIGAALLLQRVSTTDATGPAAPTAPPQEDTSEKQVTHG